MPTKWGLGRWGTFRWGHSTAFYSLLAQKTGVHVHRRIIWRLDAGDQDVTEYFISGATVSAEKERAPDRLTAGDATLIFSNKDGTFTETDSASFLYGVNYHNRNITIEVGLELPSGTIEYHKVATMKVRSVQFADDGGRVTIRVYDQISRLLNESVNRRPSTLLPTAGGSNVGDGDVTEVATRPFTTVAENWTLTCTLGGADGVATFSVVGSVSGNIGTATSGTEFVNATTGGLRFTIRKGTVNWTAADTFTFSTVQMMEWTAKNPIKILWSILTGYNYDTNVAEAWLTRTPQLDRTQSSANTDLDWASFENAVDAADLSLFTLTGFLPWDADLVPELEEIVMHFLGAMNVDAAGRLKVKIFVPELGADPSEFADDKKVTRFAYERSVRDIVNRVEITYQKTTNWPWSDDRPEDTLDGIYVAENTTSQSDLDQTFALQLSTRWHNAQDDHVSYLATRIIDKYGRPPRRFKITTGIDALEVELGEIVALTSDKYGFDKYQVEVMRKDGRYADHPVQVDMEAEDTGTYGINWGFLGSSADEGDGLSPQAADFDSATASDKQFCYASQTGGSGSATGPDFYMF